MFINLKYIHKIKREYLVNGRCCYSDAQTPGADGRYDLTGGVTAEDEATRGRVLLHGPTQGVLGVFGQSVNLSQHHHCNKGSNTCSTMYLEAVKITGCNISTLTKMHR